MGKWYKNKKSAGCAMCKYWKHGGGVKFEDREFELRKRTDKLIREMKLVNYPETWERQNELGSN